MPHDPGPTGYQSPVGPLFLGFQMQFEEPSNLPEYRNILGVPVVTIPLADYCELLDCQRQFQEALGRNAIGDNGESTLFARDPEVAVFVVSRFGIMTAGEIVEAVKEEYGEHRAPLIISVNRLWVRMRRNLPPHVRDMAI